MLIISVFNFKGGTGKSATTLNLGASLASSKRQILLIDTDGQRTLSFALGLDGTQPTTLDWLNNTGDIIPPPPTKKKQYQNPRDIGMFQKNTTSDLFNPPI
ncbi:MAG: ParA family protein [Cyanobacteria bacterium P01_D01_bin.116]